MSAIAEPVPDHTAHATPRAPRERARDARAATGGAHRQQPQADPRTVDRPALLALIVAPALKIATGGLHSGIDYESFVGVGAVGLVVPLSCIFAGLA